MQRSKADKAIGRFPHFVADGRERLVDGIRAKIREVACAEFSERLAEADWLTRVRIRIAMRNEIERRVAGEVEKQMPSDDALW